MTEYRGWACGPLPSIQPVLKIQGGTRYTAVHFMHVRDMDGLVVCAVERHRHRRGFKPRLPSPSRGPLARSRPLPPSTSRSTIDTADGWVVCLVVIFFSCMQCVQQKFTTPHVQQPAPPRAPPADGWRVSSPYYSSSACRGSNRQLQGGQR